MGACTLEVKTLKGKKVMLLDVPIQTTVGELYEKVAEVEDTQEGKWKIMLIARSPRTLKPITDQHRKLHEYGTEPGHQYRVEIILDMGACHSSCARN